MRAAGRIVLIVALVAQAVILSGCKTSGLVSESQEIDIGRQAAQDIERQHKLVNDPALNQKVNHMGQTLAARSDRPNLKYTFKILDTKRSTPSHCPAAGSTSTRASSTRLKATMTCSPA